MNHLAHALLSGPDADVLLGGLVADYWRGAPDPAWPDGVRAGVVLHRRIDGYTDSHPDVRDARGVFEPPFRRYAGILIDVYFDHVLARKAAGDGAGALAALSRRVADLLAANADWLPPDLNRFAGYFRAHGLFASYGQRPTIERVLGGIGMRLRHDNPLADSGPALWQRASRLDVAFERFYPQVEAFAAELRRELEVE